MTKLSHSRANCYLECPRKFKFSYIEELSPIYTSSALLFGKAIDVGIEAIFKGESSYSSTFISYWDSIDKRMANYSKSDLDISVLDQHTLDQLKQSTGLQDLDGFIKEKEKSLQYLKREDKDLINQIAWQCLYTKGLMFLEHVFANIKPLVTKVISLQEEISIKAGNGDEIVGFIDMVAEMEGYDKPVILDFKTSSKKYSEKSGTDSQQMNIYHYAVCDKYNTDLVGFIVVHKNLEETLVKTCSECKTTYSSGQQKNCKTKKCPGELVSTSTKSIIHQIVVNKVDANRQSMIMENMTEIAHGIKSEVFPRNFSACYNYNQRCQYYEYCVNNNKSYLKQKEQN